MKKEKSPSDKLKEIDMVSEFIESFLDESRDPEQARRQLNPFIAWLFNESLDAISEMEESNELRENVERT